MLIQTITYFLIVITGLQIISEKMAFVVINSNESIESALRRFKRKVISEEFIKDLKSTLTSFLRARKQSSSLPTHASVTVGVSVSSVPWAPVPAAARAAREHRQPAAPERRTAKPAA